MQQITDLTTLKTELINAGVPIAELKRAVSGSVSLNTVDRGLGGLTIKPENEKTILSHGLKLLSKSRKKKAA